MIGPFVGQHRFLSSFYPVQVTFAGLPYPSVEHAYQAAKTTDLNVREDIRKLSSPGQAKRFGRTVAIRPAWDEIKREVMHTLVSRKFKHTDLRKQLLDTGNERLVEVNKWGDTYWGVYKGEGENYLGRILMAVRSEIRRDN